MGDIEQASSSESVATFLYLRTCLMSALLLQFLPETKVATFSVKKVNSYDCPPPAQRVWYKEKAIMEENQHNICPVGSHPVQGEQDKAKFRKMLEEEGKVYYTQQFPLSLKTQ